MAGRIGRIGRSEVDCLGRAMGAEPPLIWNSSLARAGYAFATNVYGGSLGNRKQLVLVNFVYFFPKTQYDHTYVYGLILE